MARIDSQLLFLTTSPRTPEKMIPEIELLIKHFNEQVWNPNNQRAFMDVLRNENFFNGQGAVPVTVSTEHLNRLVLFC